MSSSLTKLRALLIRLSGSVRGRSGAGEFDEELESHVAMHTAAGIAAGLDGAEARRQALVKLGGAEQVRQARRDRAGLAWLENLLQDVRYGARTLRRAPGFALTAITTVGLGIGACTAIFSLVNAVLIRSLPYGDAGAAGVFVYAESEFEDSARGDLSGVWRLLRYSARESFVRGDEQF